tara:strand:+ start:179 stop:616 length:438 start_codon:yes stop_codon:yes gene_type:complete
MNLEEKNQIERIEKKVDVILSEILDRQEKENLNTDSHLHTFTIKQHCVLQILLHGGQNAQIADIFNISTNTAKVHVRSIAKKLKVNRKEQIIIKMLHEFEKISENTYKILTKGIPKDWWRTYSDPCPFAKLYRQPNKKGGEDLNK